MLFVPSINEGFTKTQENSTLHRPIRLRHGFSLDLCCAKAHKPGLSETFQSACAYVCLSVCQWSYAHALLGPKGRDFQGSGERQMGARATEAIAVQMRVIKVVQFACFSLALQS